MAKKRKSEDTTWPLGDCTITFMPGKSQVVEEVEVAMTAREDGRELTFPLGLLRESDATGEWYISRVGGPSQYDLVLPWHNARHRDARGAALALAQIITTIRANKLTDETREYMQTRARMLDESRGQAVSQFFRINRERADLATLARRHGFDLRLDNVSMREEVRTLLDFMTKHNDELYEGMGKEFARTLRALVANVVRLADPAAALEV